MSDSEKRVKRLERLMRVQTKKREIEEWRLAHLKRERSELDQKETDIIASLGVDTELHGLFLDSKVRTLRRNDRAKAKNSADQVLSAQRLEQERRREKQAERFREEAERVADARADQKELQSVLENLLSRADASFE
ncbi:hypothetical protein [Consotaella salsifontis]|uniref:Flagellar FliJ protein n=1 Tax=Consotaella salsifontis TaxID=1365950 RepID=A0A1T4NT13_9HYPH|nr:hypothetical protein [Consotaella salsifontis]SJZ82222.1 hypothetical protein SAMN05428963_103169 [Consotaella salsifontis]